MRRAWRERGAAAAAAAGARLAAIFGPDRLHVEIQRHLVPGEEAENDFLVDWARAAGLPLLATNGVLHATPEARTVASTCSPACANTRRSTPPAGSSRATASGTSRAPPAMAALFADLPEAVANTEALAERLEFTLANLGYRFPDYPRAGGRVAGLVPAEDDLLRGAAALRQVVGDVRRQLERELALIAKLGFAGYFLIVWDLCAFARERGILVQGRGSAANSAVCYALGITAVDPIESKLLFERFLSEGRTDWPDIDLDLPSGERREEVIQEVYRRYGRRGAAMTANVITYQGPEHDAGGGQGARLAGRRAGPVLEPVPRRRPIRTRSQLGEQLQLAGVGAGHPRLPALLDTCRRVRGLPRHLGQHSGGMVLSAGALDRFVPLENARMPGRSVLQWDKTDCEDMGIVKVDLLGLGMMAVLQDALTICAQRGQPVDLARLPKDDPATFG